MVNTNVEHAPSDSSRLALLHPTPEEKQAIWRLNGQAWKGSMDIPTYIRRELHLEVQAFTRHGGVTFWILVDTALPPNARPILASCESFRKKAMTARDACGISDIISHGIGSVFCNPEYRGRGYAQRMIQELGRKLDFWQQASGDRATFTVLFSDIGKSFYSRMAWHAFPSTHIALPPLHSQEQALGVRYLHAQDLPELCNVDEQWLRKNIEQCPKPKSDILVCLVPDVETMQWHHAREEFAARELFRRDPQIKGAYAKTEEGEQVWCIWTRTYGSAEDSNVLNILRLVIEGDQILRHDDEETSDYKTSNQAKIKAASMVLRVAQFEAAKWNMKEVQLWNPTSLTLLAAREIEPLSCLIDRDEESIASLRWHGVDPQDHAKVIWVGNEKYGWC